MKNSLIVAFLACAAIAIVFYTQDGYVAAAAGAIILIAGYDTSDGIKTGGNVGAGFWDWLFNNREPYKHVPTFDFIGAISSSDEEKQFENLIPDESLPSQIDSLKLEMPKECNNRNHYTDARKKISNFGYNNFKRALQINGIFDGDVIASGDKPFNPFARLVTGKMPVPYGNLIEQTLSVSNNFEEWNRLFMIAKNRPELDAGWNDPSVKGASMSVRHRFLLLRNLDWHTFNVITMTMSDVELLQKMRECALAFTAADGWSNNIGLFFHCWPHNSVQALHLHIVDLSNTGHTFEEYKYKNLPLDEVIASLNSI